MHGQLLILGIQGLELTPEEAELYKTVQPGGYVLFGRNIESPEQVRKLTDDLRELSESTPIISIDQEGGRVSRTRLIGNEPPSAESLRQKNDPRIDRPTRQAHRFLASSDGLQYGFMSSLRHLLR